MGAAALDDREHVAGNRRGAATIERDRGEIYHVTGTEAAGDETRGTGGAFDDKNAVGGPAHGAAQHSAGRKDERPAVNGDSAERSAAVEDSTAVERDSGADRPAAGGDLLRSPEVDQGRGGDTAPENDL